MGIVGQEAILGYDAAGWLQHDLGSSGISCPHDSIGSARPSQAKYDLVGCDVTRVPFSRTITCAKTAFKLSHLFLTWLSPGIALSCVAMIPSYAMPKHSEVVQ